MNQDKARKVIDALKTGLHYATGGSPWTPDLDKAEITEAIAIMREKAEPPPCPTGEPCKHAGWCTEVYCQGIPVFRNQYKPEGWMSIETAPKDGTAIMLGARCGAWIGKYLPVYQSGFKPDNPWSSLMLNHDHLYEKWQKPTHWMPLPEKPGAAPQAPAEQGCEACVTCGRPLVEISDAEIYDLMAATASEGVENCVLRFARALLERTK